MNVVFTALSSIVCFLFLVKGIESLQCFNCQGLTNYDPDQCEEPAEGRTIIQECDNVEVCEKKVHHIDRWHKVISRGCSANCDGRAYIYTDDFQVHCCDEDFCNSSPTLNKSTLFMLPFALLLSILFKYLSIL